MKLIQFKEFLEDKNIILIQLPDQSFIPHHFHVTELGLIEKTFVDCGGIKRNEKVVSFQIWVANDFDHRLKAEKLLNIINLAEQNLNMDLNNLEIEVEYQTDTIGKYALDNKGIGLLLLPKKTNCLAPDKCGVTKSCC